MAEQTFLLANAEANAEQAKSMREAVRAGSGGYGCPGLLQIAPTYLPGPLCTSGPIMLFTKPQVHAWHR